MNKLTRFLFTSWLVMSGTAGSPTPCIADTSVSLKPDAEISRSAVRLGDLFYGVPAEIDRDIAQAPQPCKPAVYDETVLNKLAQTYRLDWQARSTSNHVILSSACTRISSDMIRDAVITKIQNDINAGKLSFEVVFDSHSLDVTVPGNEADFKLENFVFDITNKNFRTDLTAQTPRGPFVQTVKGRVLVKRSVPVLTHRLERGTTIAASDLDWIQLPEERVSVDVVTEPSQLIGREVRRDSPEGVVLRAHDVMPQRLVQRGSLVTLKIETPFILVTSQGKAMQDGAEGETIRVTNTQSNRTVEGVVTAPGVVEVNMTRKVASVE